MMWLFGFVVGAAVFFVVGAFVTAAFMISGRETDREGDR